MKLKQLSNVLQSLIYISYSVKSKLNNYKKYLAARKFPQPPPDFSVEIRELSEEIMTLFTTQMGDAMERMHYLMNPTFKTQLEYLKVQVKFEHVKKLNERFEGFKDDITDDLEEQIEVFGSVYQFYSFVQANAIDSMLTLNDRLEYETLWRFPIREHLDVSIGEKDELANSGRFKLFSDLEQILEEMNLEHSEFQSLSSIGDKRDKSLRFNFTENSLESFYMKGGLLIEINPLDYNCYDCFNPRLNFIEMNFTTADSYKKDKMHFEVIHMGAELFPIMEGGVRQITFFQNSPKEKFKTHRYLNSKIRLGPYYIGYILNLEKTIEIRSSARSEMEDTRSPFAQFLVKLNESSYSDCSLLEFRDKEKCEYSIRAAIKNISLNFDFEFSTNFPDAVNCKN